MMRSILAPRLFRTPFFLQLLAPCLAAAVVHGWIDVAVAEDAVVTPPPVVAPVAAEPSLLDQVLALNLVQEPELDLAAARAAFLEVVEKARTAVKDAKTPKERIASLSTVLLKDRNVTYLTNEYWRDSTLAASLIRRKANCLATSTLFVLVGQELKLPIRLVVIPGHAFVRWDDGATKVNIETTNGGAEYPDNYYLYREGVASYEDVQALGWGTSLDTNGFLAELHETASNHRYGENRLLEALSHLETVEKLAPHRRDLKLRRIALKADATGNRRAAKKEIIALTQDGTNAPSVLASGALWLAAEAAGERDYELERRMLLYAFSRVPKTMTQGVLQRLAFCHRSLKDYRGAVRYMELAITMTPPGSPTMASDLYNLAILQKNDGRLDEALKSIRAAQEINSESWNLQMIEAGYMVLNGERDAGIARFEKIVRPRGDVDFYESMLAWFYSVSHQREKFFAQFERAMSLAKNPHSLVWVDQDVDLDVYRNEPEFKAIVEKARARILGKKPPKP